MAMVSTPSSTPEEPAVSPPSAVVPELPESAVSPELPVPPQAARDAVMARAISKVNNLFMFLHLSHLKKDSAAVTDLLRACRRRRGEKMDRFVKRSMEKTERRPF